MAVALAAKTESKINKTRKCNGASVTWNLCTNRHTHSSCFGGINFSTWAPIVTKLFAVFVIIINSTSQWNFKNLAHIDPASQSTNWFQKSYQYLWNFEQRSCKIFLTLLTQQHNAAITKKQELKFNSIYNLLLFSDKRTKQPSCILLSSSYRAVFQHWEKLSLDRWALNLTVARKSSILLGKILHSERWAAT